MCLKLGFFSYFTYLKSTDFIELSSLGICDILYQPFVPASAVGESLAGLECAETVGVVSKINNNKKIFSGHHVLYPEKSNIRYVSQCANLSRISV